MQIAIELDQNTGSGTISIDGSEPQQFEKAEQVCQVIEQLAGQPDGDDQAQAQAQAQEQDAGMQQGFSGVRGGGL